MNSPGSGRIGRQTPRVARYPQYVSSAAPEVIELAKAAGLILDPWQQFVLLHGLGELAGGRWAAFRACLWVARQNGKGAVIEALELAWLFLFGEKLILHSAHEYKTAQEAFLRIKTLIESNPDFDKLVTRYWQANGEQGIELKGGRRLRFVARSRTSGRGFSGDKNILDEAQELTVEQMAALLPTMSARPNPQMWFFGTPPESSEAWAYNLRAAGEPWLPNQTPDHQMAYFDFGGGFFNPDDLQDVAKLDDIDLRYETNPAMGIRITPEFVAGERILLGSKFAGERLGMWLPPPADASTVIPEWAELADAKSRRVGDVAFAIDVSPDRKHSAISMAGKRADGLWHWELVEFSRGTEWIVARIVELKVKHSPVAIALDSASPAFSLVTDLNKAKIKESEDAEKPLRGDLLVLGTRDVAAAFGMFVDAANQGRGRHIDQPELNTALAGAQTRPLGGDGLAWARKGDASISPLVAVTEAHYAFETRAHLVQDDRPPNIW